MLAVVHERHAVHDGVVIARGALDEPGGAARFVQGATGYDHTIVNGVPFMDHGEHTGDLAGRILRSTD